MAERQSLCIVGSESRDELDNPTPKIRSADASKGLDEPETLACRDEVRDAGTRLLVVCLGRATLRIWHTFKKEGNGYLQNTGDLLQAAGADAVHTFFVFLNLLKGDANLVGQVRLAHLEHQTAHADAAAHVFVDWVWRIFHHTLTGNENKIIMAPKAGMFTPVSPIAGYAMSYIASGGS